MCIKNPFIVTDSDDARQILMGHVDPKKFAVVDVNHELKLVEKSAVLRIKEAERRLSVVPLNQKTKADINIILYINSWKMEVNFNQLAVVWDSLSIDCNITKNIISHGSQ